MACACGGSDAEVYDAGVGSGASGGYSAGTGDYEAHAGWDVRAGSDGSYDAGVKCEAGYEAVAYDADAYAARCGNGAEAGGEAGDAC